MLKKWLLMDPAEGETGGGQVLPPGKFTEDGPGGESFDEPSNGEGAAAEEIFESEDVFSLKKKEEKQALDKKEKELDEINKVEEEQALREKNKQQKPAKEEELEVKEDDEEAKEEEDEEKPAAKQRDYTGLAKEDIEFLKKQPNNIYNAVAPIMKERAKIQAELATVKTELETIKKDPNRIPDAWYENERAIELTPEYETLATHYERYQMEGAHWQRQIIQLQNKQPYTLLTKYNKETGQYEKSAPQPCPEDDNARGDLIAQLEGAKTKAFTGMASAQQKAEALKAEFMNKNKQVNTYYDPIIKERIDTLPAELKPTKEQIEEYYAFVHPAHRNSSQTKVAANLFGLVLNQGKVIKALMAEQGKSKKLIEDERAAGPKNRTSQNGATTNGTGKGKPIIKDGKVVKDAVIDFDDLKNEMGLDN